MGVWKIISANCNAHLAESVFQTWAGKILIKKELADVYSKLADLCKNKVKQGLPEECKSNYWKRMHERKDSITGKSYITDE